MKRELTSTDKKVISEIINRADTSPANYLLANAFMDIFESSPVAYKYESRGKESLIYYCDGEHWTRDKAVEVLTSFEAKIVDRSDLIQFLVDEKYISLLKLDRESLHGEIRQYVIGRDWIGINYSDFGADTFMVFRNSFCRIIITERLRRFSKNDFLTDEECLLNEAKKQTALAREQVEEAKNQSAFAKEQAEEAKAQTVYVEKQVDEAKEQTSLAKEQVEEAKKQTKNSLKQTYVAIGALVCSIIGLVYTAYQASLASKTLESHMAEQQPIYHIFEDIPNTDAPYYCQLIIENTGSQTIGNPYVNIKTIYEFVRCDANQYPNQWDTVYFNVAYWLWPIVLSNVDTVCVTSNNSSDYIFSNLQTACNTFSDSGTRYMLYKHDYISINYTDIYNRKHTKYYRDGFPISYETYKQETNVVEEHQCRVQDIRWETLVDSLRAKSSQ